MEMLTELIAYLSEGTRPLPLVLSLVQSCGCHEAAEPVSGSPEARSPVHGQNTIEFFRGQL